MRHARAWAGILLVFLGGGATGALSTSVFYQQKKAHFWARGPEAAASAFEQRLTGNLGLTAGQATAVHQIFLENLAQRRLLQKQIEPQIQLSNRETIRRIAAELTPEQREKLRANAEEFKRRTGHSPFALDDRRPRPAEPPPPR